jgi:hypothetical protein
LTSELTSLNVGNVEILYLCLLKQIQGGNVSPKNLALCDSLLKLLCEKHKSWLSLNMRIIPTFVYTYLRVIADHKASQLHQLQQREIKSVIELLKDKVSSKASYNSFWFILLIDLQFFPVVSML